MTTVQKTQIVSGAGLGLRRELLTPLQVRTPESINFFEIAPENWIKLGGRLKQQFRALTEKNNFVSHGLSLSLGGITPVDITFVNEIKSFLKEHQIKIYTEHLSYCSDQGHLYDLMPIPFTEEAVHYVAKRIRQVQDILEQKIAVENVSYYAAPGQKMTEIDFLNAVLKEADCLLLLDVNNIYVNSINHNYNAQQFLKKIPEDKIAYIHVAGHYQEAPDLLIDTHGANVNDPVWALLQQTYRQFGILPTLLERDFNIPPLDTLLKEVEYIHQLQNESLKTNARHILRLRA